MGRACPGASIGAADPMRWWQAHAARAIGYGPRLVSRSQASARCSGRELRKRGPRQQLRPAVIHIITPMALGRGLKVGYSRRSGPTGGRWNSSPWKGCSPFSGRSWIGIFNTRSGSSAISGRSVLRPYFACGGRKLTRTANTFRNLSVTHLKNDTANYLGLGRSRPAFPVPQRRGRGIALRVGRCQERS
jgi:hypothetical protein